MPKKKQTKKKAKPRKKVSKRKPKSVPPTELSDQEKSIHLHQKIHTIMKENPQLECDLKGEDDEGRFGYVEAATVFRMYGKAMAKHNLTFIPIEIKPLLGSGCVLIKASYQITDITTGWSEVVQSCGLGINGQWACNTAMTLAYKQALLNTFTCSWPQPEEYREEVQRVSRNAFGPANSPQQISEVIKEFMGNYPITHPSKGKQNAPDRNRKKS